MKLRNKKTGEIIGIYKGEITLHYNQGRKTIHFKRLEDLEEWEDYEEPKEYWAIDCFVPDGDLVSQFSNCSESVIENRKSIGNYFLSKEEAEKAVEKLKAWKRLKDKGFRFDTVDRYEALCGNGFNIPITATMPLEAYTDVEVSKDLDICFGGEE